MKMGYGGVSSSSTLFCAYACSLVLLLLIVTTITTTTTNNVYVNAASVLLNSDGVFSVGDSAGEDDISIQYKTIDSSNWWSSGCRTVHFSSKANNNNNNAVAATVDNYSAIECKSVRTLKEEHVPIQKVFTPTYVSYRYMLDTPDEDICGTLRSIELFLQVNASSCDEYFCSPAGETTEASITKRSNRKLHSRLLNFCRYCARADFDDFHLRVANGSCPDFVRDFPADKNFCSNGGRFQQGFPIDFSRVANSAQTPFICACQKSKLYGFKCDGYSMLVIPFSQFAQPFVMFGLCLLLMLGLSLIYIVPTVVAYLVDLVKNRDEWTSKILNIFSLRLFVALFLLGSLFLLALENMFAFPFTTMFNARLSVGDGIFRATSLLCLFISMFTLFTLWVQVMYKGNSLGQRGIPILVKVALGLVYVFFILFVAFPIAHHFSFEVRRRRVMNLVFFPLIFSSVVLFSLGFLVYGTRLYLQMRATQKLTIFALKFTRFMIIISALLIFIAIQILFVIIEFTGKKVHFGISYRLLNFPLLDYTIVLVTVAIVYQLVDTKKLREAFPCLQDVSCCTIGRRESNNKETVRLPNEKDETGFEYARLEREMEE